jgi:hypothetical protein
MSYLHLLPRFFNCVQGFPVNFNPMVDITLERIY